MFYDLKCLQEEWGQNFNVNSNGEKVKWHDVKILRVHKENIDSFFYKTSYKDDNFSKVCVNKKNQKSVTDWNNLQ